MKPIDSYTHSFHLPAPRQAVFDLFADPHTLDLLTPPWFRLRPLGEVPQRLAAGEQISYRLRWRGVPLLWTSLITEWSEPHHIVYEQHRGPYRIFRHEHHFSSLDGGTEVLDRVLFRAPGGPVVNRWIARPDLRRIFAYRERRALQLLQPAATAAA